MREILVRLNASAVPEDMDLPGFRLDPLKGAQAGFRAVTVRANRRGIFRFEDSPGADVDELDCNEGGHARSVFRSVGCGAANPVSAGGRGPGLVRACRSVWA